MALARGHDGRRGGVVGAGGETHPALPGRPGDAVSEIGGQLGGVVLGVPAVPQERVRDAGGDDVGLGGLVVRGEDQRRGVGVGDRGVDDAAHAGALGGVHGVAALTRPIVEAAARDQHEGLGAGERGVQARGVGVVGLLHRHAAGGEVGDPLGRATGRRNARGGDAAIEQGLHDQATQVAGDPGDDDRHVFLQVRDAGWRGCAPCSRWQPAYRGVASRWRAGTIWCSTYLEVTVQLSALEPDPYAANCPTRTMLDRIGDDRWTVPWSGCSPAER